MAFPPVWSVPNGTKIDDGLVDTFDTDLASALVAGVAPTRTPAQTTAEVIEARGNLGSLTARLDAISTADGDLISEVTLDMLAQQFHENLGHNGAWICWPNGDASAPAAWTLSGAGAAVARDTAVTPPLAVGAWSMRLTPGAGAVALLTQDLAPAAIASRLAGLGLFLGADTNPLNLLAVGLCRTTNANEAGLYITAGGIGTTIGATHPGGNTWKVVYADQNISASAGATLFTSLSWGARVVAGGAAAHFSPIGIILSRVPIPRILPPELWVDAEYTFAVPSGAANGTNKWIWSPGTIGRIEQVQLRTETATAADWILDVNTRDSGGTYTTMFTAGGRPRILNGARDGGAAPNGTYARQCFKPAFGATLAEGSTVTFDLDSGGGHGDAVYVTVHYIRPARSWRAFYDYNS